MGVRKRQAAENRKEAMKTTAIAKLSNSPHSPRKTRTVADLIRGQEVMRALNILKYNLKAPSARLEKLVQAAIVNWEAKTGDKIDEGKAYVKTITVDSARMVKRLRPAPQGRGYRIRKRSNHVTVVIDSIANKAVKGKKAVAEEAAEQE